MRRQTKGKNKKRAESEVYSYGASERAMASRRGTIGDGQNLDAHLLDDFTLEITNIAMPQHPAGANEVDFVEQGMSNYRQPYPRPFMEEA